MQKFKLLQPDVLALLRSRDTSMEPLKATVPGLHVMVDEGTWRAAEETLGEERIGIGFLVAIRGDFLVVRPEVEPFVTVNRRPCLAGLELLDDRSRIRVRLARGVGAAIRHAEFQFTYRRTGPPIEFAISRTSSVRCAYSGEPLAGRRAIRCPACFGLFGIEVWQSELLRHCPTCGMKSWRYGL